MNANRKPELYVVQTPADIEAMNNIPWEEREKQVRLNQVYKPTPEELAAQEAAKHIPAERLIGASLRLFGNMMQFIIEQGAGRFQLEQAMIRATRAQRLRQAVQQGKRLRLGQMQEMLCCYKASVHDIAEMTDLPVDVVQAAMKRWFFF